MDGRTKQLKAFGTWFSELPHLHKIVIAGNHELTLERFPQFAKRYLGSAHYLQDMATTICGIKFYGSPWQPEFHNWAFNLPRGDRLKRKWQLIPQDVDVLITHGPPFGILDILPNGESVGCSDLLERVRELQPMVHAFGHIHGSYGSALRFRTLFLNASICDEDYRPANRPIIVDIDVSSRTVDVVTI